MFIFIVLRFKSTDVFVNFTSLLSPYICVYDWSVVHYIYNNKRTEKKTEAEKEDYFTLKRLTVEE